MLDQSTDKKKKANFYHQKDFKTQVIVLSKKSFYKKSITTPELWE